MKPRRAMALLPLLSLLLLCATACNGTGSTQAPPDMSGAPRAIETHAPPDGPLTVYAIDPCGGCQSAPGVNCGTCTVMQALQTRYEALLSAHAPDMELTLLNMHEDAAHYDARNERLRALGLDPRAVAMPTAMVGDAVFAADGTQDDAIVRYLSLGEYDGYEALQEQATQPKVAADRPRVLYLSSAYCESCAKISPWLAVNLPDDVTLEQYDIAEEEGMLLLQGCAGYFDRPADTLYVPAIVYGDTILVGKDEIYLSLLSRIAENPDAQTPANDVLIGARAR